ncbi:hypothetical protein GOODEAATRI_025001, partial [Goodea atripinnis]
NTSDFVKQGPHFCSQEAGQGQVADPGEQVKGTAMGKRFDPSYANIFMAAWELEALKTCHKKPMCFSKLLIHMLYCIKLVFTRNTPFRG